MALVAIIRRHPLWTIGVLAAVLRGAFVLATRTDPMKGVDSLEYDGIARALLAGTGMTTDVGFVRPPLYPMFLALGYVVGGIPIVQIAQIIIGAVTAILIGVLARDLYRDDRAAWMGALAAAIYPWFFQYVGAVASENLFTFLAVAAFVLILRSARDRRPRSAVTAGALFGLAALARANLLVLAPGLTLWLWWRSRRFASALVFCCFIVVALAPFTIYNLTAGHGLVVGSSGGGLAFYIGNNADTTRFYGGRLSNDEWLALNHDSIIGAEALRQAGCDPVAGQRACISGVPIDQADAFWYSAAFRYIVANPWEWAGTVFQKLLHYWRPWVEPRTYSVPVVFISGVSFGTIALFALMGLRRMERDSAAFVLAVLAGSTMAAVLWTVQLRYRFALLDPVMIAAASLPMMTFFTRARALTVRADSRPEARSRR